MQPKASLYYCAAEDIPSSSPDDVNIFLDASEIERYGRMCDIVAAQFLQGRRMVKQALSDVLAVSPSDIRFAYSDNGKPRLANDCGWHFNISHCNTAVVVAISKENLGVDVEAVHRGRGKAPPPWQNSLNFMHAYTAEWVEQQESEEDKAKLFTLLWTLMESEVKLNDSSIFKARKQLAIHVNRNAQQATAEVATSVSSYGSGSRWLAFEGWGDATGKDVVALAFSGLEPTLEFYCWQSPEVVAKQTPVKRLIGPAVNEYG
ncbi:4'-phosphopantetheinyl transferase family protein [Teredinibacter haidensis]|uniref:4'-phosphopantetheinyl transferase family protein n=1 Tax=Teredinibacter haidensis TaxID=2731755 RepID=UPI000949146C|nr:4'-phosphopantetheinyl transferase superfamily protein [Teredinibacter haidensis]